MLKIPSIHTTPPGRFTYRQPETGAAFEYGTWSEVMSNVAAHRRGMSLDLAVGWDGRLEHDACTQSPHWGCFDDAVPISQDLPLAIAGKALWLELHAFAEQYPESPTEDDVSRARYWMANWRERIPRFGGCTCREDWARLEASYPPEYGSRAAFVRWASVAHDAINRKIGKPLFNAELFDAAVAQGLNVFP